MCAAASAPRLLKPRRGRGWVGGDGDWGVGVALLERLLHIRSARIHSARNWSSIRSWQVGSTDYVAAGVHLAPSYLKWMLVYEDPNTQCVWLAKALPRAWLAPGGKPVVVRRAPTRYGRVGYTLTAAAATTAGATATLVTTAYTVRANVTLPVTYLGASGPVGGVMLRLRAPVANAGKLAKVTVGGKPWTGFDAHKETVTFAPGILTRSVLEGMQEIVAEWSA